MKALPFLFIISLACSAHTSYSQKPKEVPAPARMKEKPKEAPVPPGMKEKPKEVPVPPGMKEKPKGASKPVRNVQTKEITADLSCNNDATIFLENILRPIDIRIGTDDKVRLVTTISYRGTPSYTDEEWLNELDIVIKGQGQSVVIKTGKQMKQDGKAANHPLFQNGALRAKVKPDKGKDVAIIDSSGKWVNRKANIFQLTTLYIPAKAILDINSRYANISINADLGDVIGNISNGSLKTKNINNLRLISSYCSIQSENIQQSSMNLSNVDLSLKKIGKLEITSSNSKIDMENIKTMTINSSTDVYEIQELGGISGEKKYGELEITNLRDSMNITGINADIKIRSISPTVRSVKVDNKYGDMRLPVRMLKSYSVNVEGANTTVSAPFSLKENANKVQTAESGSQTGNPTAFGLKCSDCSIDFN